MVQAEEWKKDLERDVVEGTYMNSRDIRKYLDSEYAELKSPADRDGARQVAAADARRNIRDGMKPNEPKSRWPRMSRSS